MVVGFIVDKGFHAEGYKWLRIVIMMAVEMCMGGHLRVCIRLS